MHAGTADALVRLCGVFRHADLIVVEQHLDLLASGHREEQQKKGGENEMLAGHMDS
jgi:hypothetical protein